MAKKTTKRAKRSAPKGVTVPFTEFSSVVDKGWDVLPVGASLIACEMPVTKALETAATKAILFLETTKADIFSLRDERNAAARVVGHYFKRVLNTLEPNNSVSPAAVKAKASALPG